MSSTKRSLKARVTLWVVMGIVVVFGLGGLVMRAILMVQSGQGLETYRTGKLVEFNYIGILIGVGVAVAVLGFSLLFRGVGFLNRWRLIRALRQTRNKHV